MPIYAFACTQCGHAFDKLQKMSDPDPQVCPACGATGTIQRQLTAPSFRLSGSGWYETDFKKSGDKQRNLAGEGGEGAKTADGKPAESKPETAKPATEKTPATAVAPKPASKAMPSGD